MIPRLRPFFDADDLKAAILADSSAVERFEREFPAKVNMRYGLMLPHGRSALSIFLRAFDIRGKKIVLPAYNCRVVASAVVESGNIPVFVDTEEGGGFNMDLSGAAGAVDGDTAAAVVTAMYGFPVNRRALTAFKREHPGIMVIGDSALALFTREKDRCFCEDFDFSFFSFGLGKQLSTVEGGMLVTNCRELYEKLRRERERSLIPACVGSLLKNAALLIGGGLLFRTSLYPMLYFFSEKTPFLNRVKGTEVGVEILTPEASGVMPGAFQGAVGLCQLAKMDENRIRRERIVKHYHGKLGGMSRELVELPPPCPYVSHFPILSDHRDEIAAYLLERGVHATNVFNRMPEDLPLLGRFAAGSYPAARRITDRCLLLPLYPQLGQGEQEHVVACLLEWERVKMKKRG